MDNASAKQELGKDDTFYIKKLKLNIISGIEAPAYLKDRILRPRQLVAIFHHLLDDNVEHLLGVYFDSHNKLTAYRTLAVGTENRAAIRLPDIFRPAMLSNAEGIILMHNHPSGRTKPSSIDLQTLKAAYWAAYLLGFTLLDFIIVGQRINGRPTYWKVPDDFDYGPPLSMEQIRQLREEQKESRPKLI